MSVLQQAFIATAAIVNNVEIKLRMNMLGRRLLTALSYGIQRLFNLRSKTFQVLLVFERMLEHLHFQNIIKVVTAKNQGVSRSTVNASKQISFVPRIVNVWIARTSKEVRSYRL